MFLYSKALVFENRFVNVRKASGNMKHSYTYRSPTKFDGRIEIRFFFRTLWIFAKGLLAKEQNSRLKQGQFLWSWRDLPYYTPDLGQ